MKSENLFACSDLQFGLKAGVRCQDALFTVKSAVEYFSKRGYAVNVAALDISKAFDRISHYLLFSKLMNRKFPRSLIAVLINWFFECQSCVRWGSACPIIFRLLRELDKKGFCHLLCL